MFSTIRDAVLGFLEGVLTFLHDLVEPVAGVHSWGWAIIGLTLIVRVGLLPLAIKQTRSMRAMQALQPQMKELQQKYKVDRELMRKDPETYKAKKAKLNEEMMALYQREGANPAASCLPLLAQAPIFLALFWMLRAQSAPGEPLFSAPFYFVTDFIDQVTPADPTGLAATVSNAGWPGWLLIVLMSGTMFLSQKQMMARTSAQMADNPMAQQQKILLYVMPVFLAVISFQFPLGILLYWVTTNFWQVVQQWIILREVQHEVETGELSSKPGGGAAAGPSGKGSGKGEGGKGRGGKGAGAADGHGRGKGASSRDGGRSGSGKQKRRSTKRGSGSTSDGDAPSRGGDVPPPRRSPGASSGKRPVEPGPGDGPHANGSAQGDDGSSGNEGTPTRRPDEPSRPAARPDRGHLPRRARKQDDDA